jgi:MSHA biogenesis protein MshQ
MKKRLLLLAFGWLLALGLVPAAQAANYVFPGNLPAGCSGAGPTYTCGALSLGNNDTITVNAPRPATITFSGNFDTNNAKINQGGLAINLSLVVNGVLTVGYQSVVNANVQANSVNTGSGGLIVFGGDVIASSGNVVITDKTTVAGNVTANSGSISLSNEVVVSGNLATTSGAVNLSYKAKVNGNISTTSGNISLANETVVSGGVASTNGTVQLNYLAQVLGSINTLGAITLGQGTVVGGNVVGGTAAVAVGYAAQVSGGVSSTSGTISLAQNSVVSACVKSSNSATITLGVNANANAVCCGATCGTACVANNSGLAMPPSCTSQIIAEYRMDEASWNGTTGEVKDSSGNGAHGTARIAAGGTAVANTAGGSPAYSTAGQSTCRYGEFDTSTGTVRTYSYVELPSMPTLSSGFSVTAWMRSTDVTASGQRIFVRDDNQNGWAISMGDGGTGKMRFFSRSVANSGNVIGQGTNPNAGAFAIDTNAVISANSWYFVAATVDTTNKTVTLYVYNAAGTQIAKASSLYSGTWADGTGMAAMGGETSASSEGTQANFHFKGNLDEVAFFTGAQTQTQIESRITQVRTCVATQTCIVDDFTSGTLNPALWNPVAVGGTFTPQVVDVGGQKRLRMTTAGTNQATLVQLKKWFPGAGNKIVVQFDQYAYGGNGADGVGVVFSDASVAPAPGGNGGSLGYAQKSGVNGYAGGWLGVGIDEYGNFPNPSEGRVGYPGGWSPPVGAAVGAGAYANSVAVRGSGSGTTGYSLLANSGTLSPAIWTNANTSATLQKFRITIDNTNNVNAFVTVQRDSTGTGSSYTTVIPTFDARGSNSGQAVVPANWLVSFTGGTGGSTNIHELANISICATYVNDPGGSTNASAFDCLETGTSTTWSPAASATTRPLYTKLTSTNFTFDVAALKTDGSLESNYVAAGGNTKYVQVELFDNVTPAATCSAYSGPVATQIVPFASGVYSGAAGRAVTGNFNVATARAKLICRVRECTSSACSAYNTSVPAACSTDQFSVRPPQLTVTAAAQTNTGTTGNPRDLAGNNFTLNASSSVTSGYTGTPTIDSSKVVDHNDAAIASGTLGGSFSPATGVQATGTTFTYRDVGTIRFQADAVVDSTFTAIDQTNTHCITGSTSNTLSGGKYGCNIGSAQSSRMGRWVPSHFSFAGTLTPFCAAGGFTYMGQDSLGVVLTLRAHAKSATTASASDPVVSRYTTGYTNLAPVTFSGDNGGTAVAVTRLTSPAFPTMPNTSLWSAGVFTVNDGYAFSKLANADGPYDNFMIRAAINDPDGSSLIGTANETGTTRIRYGRLRMQNAYGSELLELPVPFEAQYWNGAYYATNTLDSCTVLPMSSLVMSNFTGGLAACETQIRPVTPTVNQTLVAGKISGGLKLTAPGKDISGVSNGGSVNLAFNVTSAAAGNTCVGPASSAATAANLPWFGPNIGGRATFGIYRSPLIYLRENY